MNNMDKVNTELENYNNDMQMAKSKTRTFVSGLHILAENKIPESILHVNVFKHILVTVQDQLEVSKEYTLLDGSTVNPYYHMGIVKSFILNNILYINLLLPLEHLKAPIMKLYRVQSNYVAANMLTSPAKVRSYTKVLVRYPYMAYNDESYISLDID